MNMEAVFEEIRKERARQKLKWGDQKQPKPIWLLILFEEVGEATQACLHDIFGGKAKGTFRVEMIQVAAVSVCILEQEE